MELHQFHRKSLKRRNKAFWDYASGLRAFGSPDFFEEPTY
jgi:hypothetical protein